MQDARCTWRSLVAKGQKRPHTPFLMCAWNTITELNPPFGADIDVQTLAGSGAQIRLFWLR